jgi:molybdopterin molybdotransferase
VKEPLHPEEALALALERLPPPSQEILALSEALGRHLAAELAALVDQPPFDKSAMDGYAYGRRAPGGDLAWRLEDTIAAGAGTARELREGECALIMTGAPIPEGAVAVQRREFAEESGGKVRFTRQEPTDNIIRRGENQKAGDRLLGPRRLGPQDIGILAASGYSAVPVAVRPTVGIVSTGNELAESGAPLGPGAIYDSNGPQLTAQAAALGCDARFYGIVPDEPGRLASTIGKSLAECDLTIVSGAVSLGDFDYVPRTFESLGVRTVFHGLKMRPGKPTYYGRFGDKAVFGLPGNPVSTFVNFEVLVRPHLLARLGVADPAPALSLPLAAPLARRGSDRVEYLPARLDRGAPASPQAAATRVVPLSYRGSSMLSALAEADCLVRMDLGVEAIPEGGIVHVRLVRP